MAEFKVDSSDAVKVIEGKLKQARSGAPIASEAAANYLRDRLRAAVPFRTGKFRNAIHSSPAHGLSGKWFVRVRASGFFRFFYPIMFLPLLRMVVRRHSAQAVRIARTRFVSIMNRGD